jgi:hypothetical protein
MELRIDPAFAAALDAWRMTQPVPPSRAAAVRALALLAIKTLQQKPKQPKQ